MLEQQERRAEKPRPQFRVSLARTITDLRRAQRLRYLVFAGEMGARVPGRDQGIDCDIFDSYCDHLIVTELATGEVTGTYRLLGWAQARRAGGFYSQREFDLSPISELLPGTVEAGRACVHPRYRGSAVLTLLWGGIIDYVRRVGARQVMGCASISLADGGVCAGAVQDRLRAEAGAREAPQVVPHNPYRPATRAARCDGRRSAFPPLIRTYLRLGAALCSEPAWDPEFNTADFHLMLSMQALQHHYARRLAPAGCRARRTGRAGEDLQA